MSNLQAKADRPQLGEWCEVNGTVTKSKVLIDDPKVHVLLFQETKWEQQQFETPKRMLFIGYRTIYDGRYWWNYDDEGGSRFLYADKREAWLFVAGERSNPIYVLPCDVLRLPQVTP